MLYLLIVGYELLTDRPKIDFLIRCQKSDRLLHKLSEVRNNPIKLLIFRNLELIGLTSKNTKPLQISNL